MKKFSEDELKTLYQWIKRKEILADQKYWQEMGAVLLSDKRGFAFRRKKQYY